LRVSLLITVIASILILVPLGFSQDAMAATLPVTDQFGEVHDVDEGMFNTSNDAGCMDGLDHHHADNGMGFVTSTEGVRINDTAPTMCGYGLVGGALTGEIEEEEVDEFTAFIDTTINCTKGPDGFQSSTIVIVTSPIGEVLAESDPIICSGGMEPIETDVELTWTSFGLGSEDTEFVFINTFSSNGDEEKSCDKKLRVDKDGEFKGKSRCGLKQALGAVIIKIIGIIILGPV